MASLGGSAKSNTPKPTDSEKKAGELGVKEWNDYVSRWVPVENKYIDQVMNQADVKQDVISMAGADGAIASAGLEQQAIRAGSPQQLGAIHDARARARGLGMANAGLAADVQQMRDLQRLVTFGRGLADDSKRGLYSSVSDQARLLAAKADAAGTKRSAWGGLLGTAGAYAVKQWDKPKSGGKTA